MEEGCLEPTWTLGRRTKALSRRSRRAKKVQRLGRMNVNTAEQNSGSGQRISFNGRQAGQSITNGWRTIGMVHKSCQGQAFSKLPAEEVCRFDGTIVHIPT